ncbi:MAG: HAD-IA family hydrolase [Bacteroidales bacterium]|nr:HAD-IA family hydrolase [Bacteroidales bacterium]
MDRKQLKAVLFDMDGVLYDSMRHHVQAWKEVIESYGIPCSERDFYMLEGRTGATTVDYLFQHHFKRNATEEEKETIYARKADRFHELNDGKVMDGAKNVLLKVKQSGLSASVVTGSGQKKLLTKLTRDYEGLMDPDKIVSAFDVKYGKPEPEPYLMGLKKWQVHPEEALVVENAPLGIEAAKAAGIFTIGVNTGALEDKILLDAGADILYPSMQALADNWDKLLERFA